MAKTSKFKIKRINVMQASIVMSLIAFFFSFVFVLLYGIFLTAIISNIKPEDQALPPMSLFGATFFLLPTMYGAFAFISTAIIAFLFNLIAKWIGGIEVDGEILEEVQVD